MAPVTWQMLQFAGRRHLARMFYVGDARAATTMRQMDANFRCYESDSLVSGVVAESADCVGCGADRWRLPNPRYLAVGALASGLGPLAAGRGARGPRGAPPAPGPPNVGRPEPPVRGPPGHRSVGPPGPPERGPPGPPARGPRVDRSPRPPPRSPRPSPRPPRGPPRRSRALTAITWRSAPRGA